MSAEAVYFYANGLPRLLLSCVLGSELFADRPRHLVLLHQYGYRYDALLPFVRREFDRVYHLRLRARRYSHLDQLLNAYFNPYPRLRRFFAPGGRLALFGLRSPAQKFLVRHNRQLGNGVDVFAESLAVHRYFAPPPRSPLRRALAGLLPRAFEIQHDYERFFVYEPEIYGDTPHAPRLRRMLDLIGAPSFPRYARHLLGDHEPRRFGDVDVVLLGQPLSNFDGALAPDAEERLLREMIGDARALVLPHPNERLADGVGKYRVLPNARVAPPGGLSEAWLHALRPRRTMTYFSTASLHYARWNRDSVNQFFPLYRSQHDLLVRLREKLPNLEVSDRFVVADHPFGPPPRRR